MLVAGIHWPTSSSLDAPQDRDRNLVASMGTGKHRDALVTTRDMLRGTVFGKPQATYGELRFC